jgi:predicted secreted protein
MWHFPKSSIHWAAPALLIVLLSACDSENPLQGQVEPTESPVFSGSSIVEPKTAPLAKLKASPSATPAPIESPQPIPTKATVDDPTARRQIPVADPEQPTVQAPERATPAQSTVGSDSLNPTFRAMESMAGFSADGHYYVYLESSRDTGAGIPKSTLQVVNVAANTCAPDACIETHFQESDANKSLSEAEKSLLQQTWDTRQQLKLTPPSIGTALPIVDRDRKTDGMETVTVQLNAQDTLQLHLRQKRIASPLQGGSAERDQAAMQLEVTYKGQSRSLSSLDNYRDWVLDYSIRSVYLSPDGERIAVLLTALKPTFEGTLGTTIVQGFELSAF